MKVNEFKLLKGYTDEMVNLNIAMERLCEVLNRYNESLIKMNESLGRISDSLRRL